MQSKEPRKPSEVDSLRDLARLAGLAEEAKSLADYGRRVRGMVRGLWAGVIDKRQFMDGMLDVVDHSITIAFRAGAQECGILPDEFSDAERQLLNDSITATIKPVEDFADQIIRANRASGGLLRSHLPRARLWINRYNAVRSEAQAVACADQKLTWHLGATEEHCTDCLNADGRTYRASTWAKYGWKPQSFDLECGGWNCDCRFEVTDAPVTPGRPPAMVGHAG